MSQPKILFHAAYFRRQSTPPDTSCTQTVRPTLSSGDLIGTVTSVSVSTEAEEAVFEKPVSGKWVDYDARNQRDRQTWTINLSELSPLFWELAVSHSTTLGSPPTTVTPGATVTHKGWLRLVTSDDSSATVSDMYMWCKVDMPSAEFPQTGFVTATITAKKLYSASNTAALGTIS